MSAIEDVMLRTRTTEMFHIQNHFRLAGMNWILTSNLVVSGSNTGGLGTLATAQFSPEATRRNICLIRGLTDKPFMINQPLNSVWAKDNIQVAIEEKVPFINYSLGKPWFIDSVYARPPVDSGDVCDGTARYSVKDVHLKERKGGGGVSSEEDRQPCLCHFSAEGVIYWT